jgi:hypothetical protein
MSALVIDHQVLDRLKLIVECCEMKQREHFLVANC